MINLIPPIAKRNLIREYWLRVLIVWIVLTGIALLVGAALLLPPYVLIHSQIVVYESTASEAEAKVEDYRSVSRELVMASQLAQRLVEADQLDPLHPYLTQLIALGGESITITSIRLSRSPESTIQPINVSGRATDRQSLAAYRDRLLAEPAVAAVDLPLSNLATDQDIKFSLQVTLEAANETTS